MMNQNVMRDPLRAGMEARAHGLPKLLLGVAAVLVFFALEMKNCAGMEGAAAVALIGAACMALLTFGAWRALKEQPGDGAAVRGDAGDAGGGGAPGNAGY